MAQLDLVNEGEGLLLKFLKENRWNTGGVPHAGSNKARRLAWSGRDNQLMFDFEDARQILIGAGARTCLLLWAPVDPSDLDAGFTLRVVHTVEEGDHLRGVACDMNIELLQGGEIHEHLEFAGSDEGGDLFRIDIAAENDEE